MAIDLAPDAGLGAVVRALPGLALQLPEVRDTTWGLPPFGGVVICVTREQKLFPNDSDTTE